MEIKNPNYKGLYTLSEYHPDKHVIYHPSEDAFSDSMQAEIFEKTGLKISCWDWWTFQGADNPVFRWEELMRLSLAILSCKATKHLVSNLFLETIPTFTPSNADLPQDYVRGAKRVNFSRGDYHDYTGAVGLLGLMNPNREEIFNNPPVRSTKGGWRGSGKEESCSVEGSWVEWVALACNVLSSENTKVAAPEIYEPALSNNTY